MKTRCDRLAHEAAAARLQQWPAGWLLAASHCTPPCAACYNALPSLPFHLTARPWSFHGFRRLFDVLRPGGRLLLTDYCKVGGGTACELSCRPPSRPLATRPPC